MIVNSDCKFKTLPGYSDYQTVWQAMKAFTLQRNEKTVDEVWSLQHNPVFTQGQAGKPEHLLNPGDIPIVQTDRGGQVTYHGPGQLVVYYLLDLKRLKLGPRELVSLIETSVINLLAHYQIKAYADTDARGVYVNQKKIASIGLRIKNQCSYHGLALNVNMDLAPFKRINPCGFKDLTMTQMAEFGLKNITIDEVNQTYSRQLNCLSTLYQESLAS